MSNTRISGQPDAWCPSCGCCAGVHKYTGQHNRNHPVAHHHQCLNCGHYFTTPVKETENGQG